MTLKWRVPGAGRGHYERRVADISERDLAVALLASRLVLLAMVVVLAVRGERLAARVSRVERERAELSRALATVQGWAAKEIGALQGELTVVRVNASAADVIGRINPPMYARQGTMRPPAAPVGILI